MSGDRAQFARATLGWLVGWGLLVWFAVAVTIRLAGHVLLDPGNGLLVAGFFGAVMPLMALVTYPVYWRLSIPSPRRPAAAACMSVPGLLLDTVLVLNAEWIFPGMSLGAVVNFGALLLFGYAVVLLTGFVAIPRAENRVPAGPSEGA